METLRKQKRKDTNQSSKEGSLYEVHRRLMKNEELHRRLRFFDLGVFLCSR